MNTALFNGELEIFSPTDADKRAAASVSKRKSKLFVRGYLTKCGVANLNGHKLRLADVKEALPTLINSYGKDTHKGLVVGTCYNAYLADENDPQSIVIADYVLWKTKENQEFIEHFLKAYSERRMGISWELLYDGEEQDAEDNSTILTGLEFAGSAFTENPAYPETIGMMEVASKKPQEYENVPDSEFADPENFKYPCDTKERTQSALHYWGMLRNRDQYTLEEQKIITKRLIIFAKKFGIDTALEAEVDEVNVENLQSEIGFLKKNINELTTENDYLKKELEKYISENESLKKEQSCLATKVDDYERKELQSVRVHQLGDLAESDKDYASMEEKDFQIYSLNRKLTKLQELESKKPVVAEVVAQPIPMSKTETFSSETRSFAAEILSKI